MGTSNAADLRAVYDLYSSSEGMSISDAVQAFGVENAAKLVGIIRADVLVP
jgi:hypothetical protein